MYLFIFIFQAASFYVAPGCSGTIYVDQAGLNERSSYLYLLSTKIKVSTHHSQPYTFF